MRCRSIGLICGVVLLAVLLGFPSPAGANPCAANPCAAKPANPCNPCAGAAMAAAPKAKAVTMRAQVVRVEQGQNRLTIQHEGQKVGLDVDPLLSGAHGGDAQIAAHVATKQVDAVFFFVDPLTSLPHDPDVRALLRVCNVHNIPLATNVATADLIIAGLVDGEDIQTPLAGP